MTWPSRLILVRHAQSVGNLLGPDERAAKPIGSNLYDLTQLGKEQASSTGAWLREHYPNPDGFYTSYYERTRCTASSLYPDLDLYEDERLAEAQRGIWHTLTRKQVAAKMPWEIERREREGYYHYRPPGGENWPDVELRIRSFNRTIHRRYPGKTLVLVTHGHWILLWKKVIHHWTIDETVQAYKEGRIGKQIANASVTVYEGVEDGNGKNVLNAASYTVPWKKNKKS